MRNFTRFCCAILLCSLVLGTASFAGGGQRGEALRSRGAAAAAPIDDASVLWRAHARLQRDLARLLGVLPFAVPADPAERDGDDTIRGGMGLSDDPDPTGSRGEDDDEHGGNAPSGDQERPGGDDDGGITQMSRSN